MTVPEPLSLCCFVAPPERLSCKTRHRIFLSILRSEIRECTSGAKLLKACCKGDLELSLWAILQLHFAFLLSRAQEVRQKSSNAEVFYI